MTHGQRLKWSGSQWKVISKKKKKKGSGKVNKGDYVRQIQENIGMADLIAKLIETANISQMFTSVKLT